MTNMLIVGAGIVLLSRCGQKTGGEKIESQSNKEILTMWTRDSTAAAVISVAKKYNKLQDKVAMEVVRQVNTEITNQFTLSLSANEAPDIISLDCTKVPRLTANDAFTDISDHFEALDYKDRFSEGMIKNSQVDGKIYAVPLSLDISILLYNKEHYRDAGLDPENPPKTWGELIKYSQKLTKDSHYDYMYAGARSGAYMFTFIPYVWNNGGEFLSESGKTCLLNEEHIIEVIGLLSDMINQYRVTPPSTIAYSWSEVQNAFLTGQASQIVLGSAAVYNFVNGSSDMEQGAYLVPGGPKGSGYAPFSGEDSIGTISQYSDVEAAWDFIEYALPEEVQVGGLAKGGCLPVRRDFSGSGYFAATPQYNVLREALEVSKTPYSLKYGEIYTPMLEDMQRCLNQEMTPQEAIADIAARTDAIMAD